MSPAAVPEGPAVIGLDLSLRHTGIADVDAATVTIDSDPRRGFDRLGFIVAAVFEVISAWELVDLVAIEGYSMGSTGAHAHELGELGGIIRWELRYADIAWVDVPPATLKKYATGNGRAGKPEVIANARERLGYDGFDDNEADALWLRAIGRARLAWPVVSLPKSHVAAIDRLELSDPLAAGGPFVVDVETKGRL